MPITGSASLSLAAQDFLADEQFDIGLVAGLGSENILYADADEAAFAKVLVWVGLITRCRSMQIDPEGTGFHSSLFSWAFLECEACLEAGSRGDPLALRLQAPSVESREKVAESRVVSALDRSL